MCNLKVVINARFRAVEGLGKFSLENKAASITSI